MRTPILWQPPNHPTTTAMLLASGLTARKLHGEVTRGTLIRLRPGVFVQASRIPEDPRQLHLLRALAEQTAFPDLVASHATAALAWGLPLPDERIVTEPPILTLPSAPTSRSRSTRWARIHVGRLPPHHVAALGELRVTGRGRTAVDTARGRSLPEALVVVDGALRAECLELRGVSRRRDLANPAMRQRGLEVIREAAEIPQRGLRPVLQALSLADPRHETPIESLSAAHMHLYGIPEPIPQFQVRVGDMLFFTDFGWPEHGVVGEADGVLKYRDQRAFEHEKIREQLIRDEGFRVVRWLGREIHLSPAAVMERISRALQ